MMHKTLLVETIKNKKVRIKNIMKSSKKNNNHHSNTNHNSHHNTHQLNLDSKIIYPLAPKLNDNQKLFLEIFYYNQEIAITQQQLYSSSSCHENTINRFIKKAITMGWIKKMQIKKGKRIYTAYVDYTKPDKLSTGQIVHDHRYTFYQITKEGKTFYASVFI